MESMALIRLYIGAFMVSEDCLYLFAYVLFYEFHHTYFCWFNVTEYIFNNTKNVDEDGDQKYDDILKDIKPFVSEGYKIYVAGHSLGGALSTLLAYKLAGSHKDWIPKPITVISVASPFVGGSDFKAGFEQLEKDGMLRHLRITNSRDIVPSIPPFSLGIRNKGLYQVRLHVI